MTGTNRLETGAGTPGAQVRASLDESQRSTFVVIDLAWPTLLGSAGFRLAAGGYACPSEPQGVVPASSFSFVFVVLGCGL